MFLVNQVFQTKASQNRVLMSVVYCAFSIWAYWGLNKDKVYYRATFIPIAEYLCVYFVLFVGKAGCLITDRIPSKFKAAFILSTSVCVTITLTVSLAMILAGNIKVYNDY